MPLTRDKQHWQKVNKIMEAIEFNFAQDLPAAEKTAFEGRVHALMEWVHYGPYDFPPANNEQHDVILLVRRYRRTTSRLC